MLDRRQQAQQLRASLVPYIESNGVEREVDCRDGIIRKYRGACIGGFVLYYETPSHRNPRPVPSCWDEALYLQANPIEDYSLTIKFCDRPDDPARGKQVMMFSACWQSSGETLHVSFFASDESHWYDILLSVVHSASTADRTSSSGIDNQAVAMPAVTTCKVDGGCSEDQ